MQHEILLPSRSTRLSCLLELLAEEEKLDLVVDGKDTSTSNTTENVGTSTLEERVRAFGSSDLAGGVERGLVLDSLHNALVLFSVMNARYILHQRSSSYDDGWCREGTTQYQSR